jgi:hypothetical protein
MRSRRKVRTLGNRTGVRPTEATRRLGRIQSLTGRWHAAPDLKSKRQAWLKLQQSFK